MQLEQLLTGKQLPLVLYRIFLGVTVSLSV